MLAHVSTGISGSIRISRGQGKAASHSEGADNHLHGTLDSGETRRRRLEKIGIEQGSQHGRDAGVRSEVCLAHGVDGVRISGWCVGPLGHRWLICDEVVVEVAGDEAGGSGLLADDVDHIFAVEVAGLAQECLIAVVVIVFPVQVLPGYVAEWGGRYCCASLSPCTQGWR